MNTIERVSSALEYISSDNRDTWIRMGMAIKSEFGSTGFELWDEWSQNASSYNKRDALSVWKSINPNGGITIGTLYHEARNNGWKDDRKNYSIIVGAKEAIAKKSINNAVLEEQKIKESQEKTHKMACAIWENSHPISVNNPYLVRKKISPTQTMRAISSGEAEMILRYSPKSKDGFLEGELLVIAVNARKMLSTIELIDGEGRKVALAGRGSKKGGYWTTNELPSDIKSMEPILIGEGVATVVSAAEATGYTAIASLSSSNLVSVATQMREAYPAAELIILADLVKTTGEADPEAIKAAQTVSGLLAIPYFGLNRDFHDTDFNDMVNLLGIDAVKQAIIKNVNSSEIWPEPQSLLTQGKPEHYPLDALPDVIRLAVEEVHGFIKAPIPIVVASSLASLSLAIQSQVDIKRAENLIGPASLFLLSIADSGERKSTGDNFFSKAIRDYDEAQIMLAKPAINKYNASIEAWQVKCSGIKDNIRQFAKGGKSTVHLEERLHELENEKPTPPRIPRLIYSDITPEALAYSLAKSWPSGGIISAEAGIVFGGHSMNKDSIMRNLSLLNVLWDGGSVHIDRRSTESFAVRGVRLTVGLQVQEATLHSFFERSGALARGTGFLARFLVSWPESTQGTRSFTEAPRNWPALEKFNSCMNFILEKKVPIDEHGMLQPILIPLSIEAKKAWVVFHDEIEKKLTRGGELYDVRDVASKIAENAARLALIFHMVDTLGNGAISVESMISATRITAWHLNEAQRFFSELALPAVIADANQLDRWLINYCQKNQTNIVPRREIQRNITPARLRQREPLEGALAELIATYRIQLIREANRKEIHVNPALIGECI